MSDPSWTEVVSAIAGIVTPVVIAIFGFIIARRQSRSDLLLKARFESYNKLAPDMNRLMCYLTFIGTWRDDSPVEIVALKRRLDANFYVAAPLFSGDVNESYRALMDLSFSTFGRWGQDAVIRSGAYRRRQSWVRKDVAWDDSWKAMFELPETGIVSGESLTEYRVAYDRFLFALVTDLNITRARAEYTTPRVSLNASPPRNDIAGAPSTQND